MKEISQIKPRLDKRTVALRHKIKIQIPINKPIAQAMENPAEVLAPKTPKAQDTVIQIPNYAIPQMKHRGYASLRKITGC